MLRSYGDPYLELFIRVDDVMLINLSETRAFSDWLSSVGGISKSLLLVFMLCSQFFSYRIFIGTVLENLFFIKKYYFKQTEEEEHEKRISGLIQQRALQT